MDIIFHIGLFKCGSSTLQNQIFPYWPGFIGTSRTLTPKANFGKQFENFSPVFGRTWFDASQAMQWKQKVMDFAELKEPGCIILSNENLASNGAGRSMPIVESIARFQSEIWTQGRVKVVIVLRNQIQRLGSIYAQLSHSRFYAGQSDFESFCESYIRGKNGSNLLYSAWINALWSAFGSENVKVMFIEEFDHLQCWQDLIEFCGSETIDASTLLKSAGRKSNLRSQGEGKWAIRPLELDRYARSVSTVLLNRASNPIGQKCHSKILNEVAFWSVRFGLACAKPIRGGAREQFIVASKSVSRLVTEFCRSDNQKLEHVLGRDLRSLGYP